MKRRITPRLQILVLIVFSLLLTACPKDNPDPVRKYAKSVDNMASAINSMIKAKRSLASNGRIAPAEDLKLTKALLIANEAVTVFHGRVKRLEDCDCVIECPGKPCEGCCFSSFRDPATRAELTVMLNNVTSAIDDLNNQGVLGVTDSVSRERLARFIATIKAAIAVFSGI